MRWLSLLGLAACLPPPMDSPDVTGLDAVDADDLYDRTLALTALGPRMSGTDGEIQARDAVEASFLDAGLVSNRHGFTWSPWQPGEAWVAVGEQTWPALPLSPSPSTDGLSVVLADGRGDDLTDAAALWFSDDGSRAEQYLLGVIGGAEAMIRVTEDLDHDGTPLTEVGHTWSLSDTPSVAVDRDVGAALSDHLGETVTIHIDSSLVVDHTSNNVLARLEGSTDDEVFVTAHYDSWHNSECAIDNALGVGMLLLLAEVFADSEPERSIIFMATVGEEQGLQGAAAWVDDNTEGLQSRGELVLNLDIPWSSEGRYSCQSEHQEWIDASIDAAEAEGLEARDGGAPWPASDHFVFQPHGVPVVWCTRQPDRHYHTESDTLDWVDMDEAFSAFRTQARILAEAARPANDPL